MLAAFVRIEGDALNPIDKVIAPLTPKRCDEARLVVRWPFRTADCPARLW